MNVVGKLPPRRNHPWEPIPLLGRYKAPQAIIGALCTRIASTACFCRCLSFELRFEQGQQHVAKTIPWYKYPLVCFSLPVASGISVVVVLMLSLLCLELQELSANPCSGVIRPGNYARTPHRVNEIASSG